MGGGHPEGKYPGYPTNVWSMSGGWYCRPKHWRRNTAIALTGIFLVCVPVAMWSAKHEVRPHYPVHPIPSQLWCKNFPDPPNEQ